MDQTISDYFSKAPYRFDNEDWIAYCEKKKLALSFPAIHVAGSNGKSSVCAMLESVYLASGYRVGALYDLNIAPLGKGIRMNGKSIEESDFCGIFEENKKDFSKFSLSSYEMQIAIAYRYFQVAKPDLVIIESSFGGSFDATNIDEMNPVLCIVTSSSLAHTNLLGTTTSEIAVNHAGILKAGCPLLIGKLDENSTAALTDYAKKNGSKLSIVDDYHFAHLVGPNYHFDFAPYHDLALSSRAVTFLPDAAIALEAVKIMASGFPVDETAIRAGLLDFSLPCRAEKAGDVVFDSASNPDALKALLSGIGPLTYARPLHVLFAADREANIASMLAILGNASSTINLTTYDSPSARVEDDYFLYASDYPFIEDPFAALAKMKAAYGEEGFLVVGNERFVSKMREALCEEQN